MFLHVAARVAADDWSDWTSEVEYAGREAVRCYGPSATCRS
jgi:hypothetical protein